MVYQCVNVDIYFPKRIVTLNPKENKVVLIPVYMTLNAKIIMALITCVLKEDA